MSESLRTQDADPNGLVASVHEELNEFEFDLVAQRENRELRAGRIVAFVEASLYLDFSEKLRELGHEAEAHAYRLLSDRREIQSVGRGNDRNTRR